MYSPRITPLVVIMTITSLDAFSNFADISCGKPKFQKKGRIVGGEEARKGEFPWLVSLTRRGGHFCGGTVISKRYILTAGHCVCTGIDQDIIKPSNLKVSVSQHDLMENNTDIYQISISAIMVYPSYTCNKASNDIALLKLNSNLIWSSTVLPACLPAFREDTLYQSYDDALAIVAGWGWTNEKTEKGGRAQKLQKARVNVINVAICQQWYNSQKKKVKIQPTQMCAGHKNGGIDACWADSGGPLMVMEEDATMVVGVVSTGIGCARPYLPGLYTRISEYMRWIKDTIEN